MTTPNRATPFDIGAADRRAAECAIAARAAKGWRRRAAALAPLALGVALLAQRAIAGVLATVGHPGAALDDAYIHFQYARAIAEGHPLRFQAGEPMTSGATSLLWPALLAPFWALGARDEAILWPAWALSFAALGALAWEAAAWTKRLAGHAAALGAGAMTLSFGGFAWCAASGMEVVPFAWVIARASRRASEWAEAAGDSRTTPRLMELVGLTWLAALFRPEGAVTALFVAATILAFPRSRALRDRAPALGAMAAAVSLPIALWVLTGSPRSNTAIAKLLPGNPYYVGNELVAAVTTNAKLLVSGLLDGDLWSAEFLPRGGSAVALAGLGAVAWLGRRTGSRWRAAAVLVLALTMFAPCLYLTFLWNRLRYIWPFATGWIVGLACLARVAGDAAAALRPRWRIVTPLTCGAFVGLLAAKLDGVLDDVAQSASGIDRQQVALGRWARTALPSSARVGVNDTGAIAYFGERRTFDVVGLTTRGEARYWVAGGASRLEHYERLARTNPTALPTHFIVYPEWMAMDMVLGPPLHEATVTDATILGGRTMRAYSADWSKLGTGEQPWSLTVSRTAARGSLAASSFVDAVDVADLESEAEHEYELLGARDGEEIAREGLSPDGEEVVDGGRTRRTVERFVAHLRPGAAVVGIARLQGRPGTHVRVLANGDVIGSFDIDEENWVERSFEVPARVAGPETHVEMRADPDPLTTYHYWFRL
ncbi:MAG: hypothetical protein M3O50_16785 [Myxococcota bacterium]|nr:hypothetical protein [Myxococcota bacterium]